MTLDCVVFPGKIVSFMLAKLWLLVVRLMVTSNSPKYIEKRRVVRYATGFVWMGLRLCSRRIVSKIFQIQRRHNYRSVHCSKISFQSDMKLYPYTDFTLLSWIPGGIRAMIVNWNTSSYSLTILNQTTPSQKYKKHLTLARNANFARHCFMNCPMEKFLTILVVYARSLNIIFMIKTTSYAILQSPSFAIATFIWVKPYHMSKNTIRCQYLR